ncbi:hypothetical protein OC846_002986 [Tilletia horrida]|uniref:ABC transporter domain-containing protein n=1 Tax=Tilletia horrida TaxID=155126 RepID=A0AAN6GPV6_9BASI|nr:hypothetical protein OC846_002986 [Tilletia horrida]
MSDIEKQDELSLDLHERLCFSWKNVSFSVKHKGSDKQLVSNVSGHVRAGEMLAVMGPSGAGKSTTLDLLAGRKLMSSGSAFIDGSEVTKPSDIRRISSYVEQEDALLGVLTVGETVRFSARLSLLNSGMTPSQIDQLADETVASLGLAAVKDNRVGTPIQRGISGGQKRRLTVANGFVARPKLLFLDEPISGLDSSSGYEVLSAIRKVARERNIAVIATVHSPTWETFSLFDRTLLLAGGQTMFYGKPEEVAPYFASLGHPCPPHTNPADHMMNLVNNDFGQVGEAQPATSGGVAAHDQAAFAASWLRHTQSSADPTQSPCLTDGSKPKFYAPSSESKLRSARNMISQIGLLTRRNLVNYSRNVLAFGIRTGMYIGMGIMVGLVWINLPQTDSRTNDRLSVHFYSVAFLGFMSVAGIPAFLEERAVYVRESKNNLYGPAAFTIAQTLVTLPFLFICTFMFSVIAYWAIGLHPGGTHFFNWLAFVYLGVAAAEMQSLLIAAIIPIFVASLAIAAFLNGFWMSVQGYFMRNLPAFWKSWAHWIDYETFAFQLLVKSDFKGLVFPCAGSLVEKTCQCSFPSSLLAAGQCAVSGNDVIDSLGYGGASMVLYAFILVLIMLFYRIAFYVALRVTV